MTATADLRLFELRWISGAKEGACCIRASSQDDAISELQEHAWFYGCPHEQPLVVWAIPIKLAETRPHERI